MTEQNLSFDYASFFELRKHLNIAHHVPGRIRLRLKFSAIKAVAEIDKKVLDDLLARISGIEDVRVNKVVGSVVISYATTEIVPAWWECLIQGSQEDAVNLLKKLMATHLDT